MSILSIFFILLAHQIYVNLFEVIGIMVREGCLNAFNQKDTLQAAR